MVLPARTRHLSPAGQQKELGTLALPHPEKFGAPHVSSCLANISYVVGIADAVAKIMARAMARRAVRLLAISERNRCYNNP